MRNGGTDHQHAEAGHDATAARQERTVLRWVGRTLSQLPEDTRLPWHRVLGAGGRISLPVGSASGDEQRARLRSEGVVILNNRVDIQRHGWRPVEHSG